MLKDYPQGSDLTLMNTMYIKPKKDEATNKWQNGYLQFVYKDNITKQKKYECIENPNIEYYIAKDEEYIDHNMLFIEKEKLDMITVPYSNLDKDIAERTGNIQFYYDNKYNGNNRANSKLHTYPKVFGSDVDIQDFYRFKFSNTYTNNIIPITKSYFDIEADVIDAKGDFVAMGECPINAVNIIIEETNTMYVLLLRNKNNPLIEEFEKSIGPQMFDELKETIRKQVGGWKNEKRFKLDNMKYEFLFYDEDNEIQLIQDLFIIINTMKPDFVLAWNMAFDIPYIIERIKVLGYNPEDIMCHPDFKKKVVDYFVDINKKNEYAERGDYANISSYSIFICQMIQFASRRKGQSAFTSFGLDFIGDKVCKVRKYDYSHIATLPKLPYVDYKTFVFYNIIDTIVQKCIEIKVGDVDYIFNKCLINNTRYQKGHRQTVYLVNRARKEFNNDGFILGNNINRFKEKPTEKFTGAFVANPSRLTNYSKMNLDGMFINIFDNVDDFDYKSLYPSLMREFNMAHNTQVGRIVIDEQIYPNENRFKDDHWNRSTEFIENLHSHVWLEFCHRWLNLANYAELYNDIEDFYTNVKAPSVYKWYNKETGLREVIHFRNKDLLKNPIRFHEGLRNPIDFYTKPNFTNINEYFSGRC